MIVSEDNVTKALQYLAQDPHPVAEARRLVTNARNAKELLIAQIYPETSGTVKERECQIELDEMYQTHKTNEAGAEFELERHKARVKAAEMLIEVWRSENANARAAERVR